MTSVLLANTAISLFGHICFMVPLVWIVIGLESVILIKYINASPKKLIGVCTLANLISTFVGIPITWFVSYFVYGPLLYFAAGLMSDPENAEIALTLMYESSFRGVYVPGHIELFASIFLLIPYYYMSVFIEYHIIKRFLKDIEPATIEKPVVLMNRFSYLFLGSLMLLIFILGQLHYAKNYGMEIF